MFHRCMKGVIPMSSHSSVVPYIRMSNYINFFFPRPCLVAQSVERRTLRFRHRIGAGLIPERGSIKFCVISISFLLKQQSNPRGGPRRVNGGEGVRERDPEAHNPSEGCRWKTAVKNNRRREALLNQQQKSLIPPEGDSAPCKPSSWEEESKTGSALWQETWCKY